jgi:hypothetical protein
MCGMTLLNFEDAKSMQEMLKVVRFLPKLTSADDANAASSSSSASSSTSTADSAAADDVDPDDDDEDYDWVRVLFYFGYTGRPIKEEFLRWLTERGGGQPTLLWADGRLITMGEAALELEFEAIEVYSSHWKVNARSVEAALQKRFHHLPLGHRLWRDADMGAKFDTEKDVGKRHKVFLTFSNIAHMALSEKRIKINK